MSHDEAHDHSAAATPPVAQLKECNKLILGLGKLAVKVLLPLMAAGGVGTGTYAAISQRTGKQQVSTSYEQFADRFNKTLEQLDQMRLRQMEISEDTLKLRLALHEMDSRLRTVEQRRAAAHLPKPPVPAKGVSVSPPAPPKGAGLSPSVTPPPASQPAPPPKPLWTVEDILRQTAPKRAPLPDFKRQAAPARFEAATKKW